MNISSKIAAIAVTLSTAFVSTNVLAQVTAHATVSNTGFQLIDLDLNDGIIPGISFVNVSNTASANIFLGNYSDGYSNSASRTTGTLREIGVGVGDAGAVASSHYSGGLFGSLTSRGQTYYQGNFNATENFSASFTLTAKTLLVYFGRLSGNVAADVPYEQYSSSNASVSLSGNLLPSGIGYQNSAINQNTSSYYNPNGSGYDQDFAVSFVNGNAVALNGSFYASTGVNGSSNISTALPVPEPETYAMMLAGLALVSAFARRRVRNPQA